MTINGRLPPDVGRATTGRWRGGLRRRPARPWRAACPSACAPRHSRRRRPTVAISVCARALLRRGSAIENQIALALDVADETLDLAPVTDVPHHAQVESRHRRGGDHVASQLADVGAADAVDVQRRLVDELEQRSAGVVARRQAELGAQRAVVGADGRDRGALRGGERNDVVVPAGNGHPAGGVLHPGEQLRQPHGGIRRPVAVVAAVQRPRRAVDREVDVDVAAHAEDDLLAAVADAPARRTKIQASARSSSPCARQDVGEVRRARLLLAVEEELDVDARRLAFAAQRGQRLHERDDSPPCRPRRSGRRCATRDRSAHRAREAARSLRRPGASRRAARARTADRSRRRDPPAGRRSGRRRRPCAWRRRRAIPRTRRPAPADPTR